jgi:hypothetical protein
MISDGYVGARQSFTKLAHGALLAAVSARAGMGKQVAHDACLDVKYVRKTIYQYCLENGGSGYVVRQIEQAWEKVGVTIDDFYAYMPKHSYIFAPTGEMWPASSVNSRLPRMPVLARDSRGEPPVRSARHRICSRWGMSS